MAQRKKQFVASLAVSAIALFFWGCLQEPNNLPKLQLISSVQPPPPLISAPAVTLVTTALQAHHANGADLRVTGVTIYEDRIVLDASITNGYKNPIKLNARRDMILVDDQGNTFSMLPPSQNLDVEVRPGATLKGKFVFVGALMSKARSLKLVTNSKFGSDASFATNPRFQIPNLPVRARTDHAASTLPATSPPEFGSTVTSETGATAPSHS